MASKRAHVFGQAQKFYGDFGDQRESSFGTDHQAGQIVTGSFHRSSADAHNFGVRQDQLETGDMVGSDAIGKRMRAAGVFRDVAANGAGFLAGGIGSEVQAVLFDGAREVEIHDARFDDGPLIFRIDFQNVVHARERDDNAASPRQSAAGESGARAAPDDGKTVAIGQG